MSKQSITQMIAALEPEAGGVTVVGVEVDAFRDSVASVGCPVRLMLPSTEGDTHSYEPTGTGRTSRMEWTVKDLLLFRPAGEGMGWRGIGYALDDYCDSYAAALTAANHNTAAFCSIPAEVLSAEFLVGVHSYSNVQYYGVMVTLRVVEYIK